MTPNKQNSQFGTGDGKEGSKSLVCLFYSRFQEEKIFYVTVLDQLFYSPLWNYHIAFPQI